MEKGLCPIVYSQIVFKKYIPRARRARGLRQTIDYIFDSKLCMGIGPSVMGHHQCPTLHFCVPHSYKTALFQGLFYLFKNVTNRNFKIHLFNTSRIAPFLQTASSTRLIFVKIQNKTICLYRHGQPNPDSDSSMRVRIRLLMSVSLY